MSTPRQRSSYSSRSRTSDRQLRPLDAIHLAAARIFAPELDGFVTYDDRLGTAAKDAGLTVLTPLDRSGLR